MKKYISLIFILGLFSLSGCQDELETNFKDPGVYTPTDDDIPSGMFAQMMERTRTFKNDYGEFWWHAGSTGGMIGHSHLVMRHIRTAYTFYLDAMNIPSFYTTMNVDAYYYGHNNNFRELPLMEAVVNDMSESDKKENEIYVTLSKMVRAYRASKAVDLFNSVPYTEGLQGTVGGFFPKFDDPWEIYKSLIDDLGTYADLAVEHATQLSESGKATFERQDIIFQGDAQKWQQFANALRLRLAVRVSGVQNEYAKQVIAEILQKGNLPTEDLLISNDMWVSKDGDHWKRGLKERDYTAFIAPTIMYKMDQDKDHVYTPGVDDPRMPVFFLPNRDTLYMPASLDFEIGQAIYDSVATSNKEKYDVSGGYVAYNYHNDLDVYMKYNAYSLWNPATMARNVEPWRAFTLAEVDFLLAEIALKNLGSTSKTAAEHVKDGVIHSIDYWYNINSYAAWDKIDATNRDFLTPSAPTESIKTQYATTIETAYNDAADLEGKMAVIIGQKYVHLNIHDYLEVFNELRRTRHPKLPLLKYNESIYLGAQVERYPYPGDVAATNRDNYAEVVEQDNFTTPVFWVPEHLRNVSYYIEPEDAYFYTEYPGVPESFSN